MDLGRILLQLIPVLLVAGLAYFWHVSSPAQRKGVLLTWLFPGLGHLMAGHRSRAWLFAGLLIPTFIAGMVLADFLNVSPFDRHPVWRWAQVPGGGLTVVAATATHTLIKTRDVSTYAIGCLYTAAACLLNIVAMCDIWDLTEPEGRRRAAEAPKDAP